MAIKIEKASPGGEGEVKPAKSTKASKGVSFIAGQAKKELTSLTNLEPSTVMDIVKDGEDWVVTIEMIEKKSIPDAMDVLGTYEVRMDGSGELLNFNRISFRKRGDTTV